MSIIYSIEKIGKLYDFIFMVSDLFAIFGYFLVWAAANFVLKKVVSLEHTRSPAVGFSSSHSMLTVRGR